MSRVPSLAVLTFLSTLAAQSSPPVSPPAAAPRARVVPYPIDLPDAFRAAIAAGTRTPTGRPGPRYWTNHARYKLQAELDPVAARLTGKATMTYVNRSPHSLDRLYVHCYQDLMKAGAQRTRTVSATKGLELGSVKLAGRTVRAVARDTILTVPLRDPLPAGAETTLEIEYAFDVPVANTAPRMGHEDDRVYYLGYWYPQFAVHDDVEGWVADPHRGNGEFYMGYADYELEITAPVGYLVRATGELQNPTEVLTKNAQDALALAATQREVVHVIDADDHDAGKVTAPSPSGKLTWRFQAENVRDAAVSIARTYLWDATHAVVKDKDGPGKDGTCMIHAVYEPNSGDWVRGAEYARHTIEYMSAHVHPYPWPHMTACEGIIGGGMEYPMMTIVGGRRPAGTIMHELIHMWFPMLVGNNEKRYAWQDEGFTSFWTLLCNEDWLRQRNPERAPVLVQREVLDYGANVANGNDAACMRHADAYGRDDFGFASYTKPAAVLIQLRGLLGDDVFFRAFRRYTADWAWKHPYPYDFFHTFTDVAQQDLEPYFRTWFFETWKLDHAIAEVVVRDGTTTVTVDDLGRATHACPVVARLADGSLVRQTIDAAAWRSTTRVTVQLQGEAVEVTLDPDLQTLDCNRDNGRWQRPQ